MPTESGSIWLLLSLFHQPPAAEGGEGSLRGYHTALKGHYIIHCVHSSQQQGQKRGISVCQDTPLGPLVLKWPEDGAPHTCFADKTAGLRDQQPLPQVTQPSTREAGDSQVHVILTCRGFNKPGQEAEEWRKTC